MEDTGRLDATIPSDGSTLAVHLAPYEGAGTAVGVVLVHGFPTGPRGAAASASTFPELADRVAREVGCVALAFNCRGTGTSPGPFSVRGWLTDIRAAVDHLDARPEVDGVLLVGVAEGGTFAVCAAAEDARVSGVATLAAPQSLRDWARDAGRFADYLRRVGLVPEQETLPPPPTLARELSSIDATVAAPRVAPRPLLLLHGTDDDVVPVAEARELADAARPSGELHLIQAGGHELRHDPRAVAALLGWLDRVR
jgi:uncharacterized protein